MKSIPFKLVEFFIIFIAIPLSFTIKYPIWIKLTIGVLGFLYIIVVLLKFEKNKFKIGKNLDWKNFWKHTVIKLLVITLITIAYVWLTNKDLLFNVLLNKPKLWLIILFIYSLLSIEYTCY